MSTKIAVIIGAGPAGLTAANELLDRTDIKPIIFEMTSDIGGISKTINYKDNRIDIGGHRFFSQSDRIMNYWKKILPLQSKPARDDLIIGRSVLLSSSPEADPEKIDNVMLVRNRISRILFLKKFFNYPISLNWQTISNLGFSSISKIGLSYFYSCLFPIKREKSLEDFLINRFGKQLYLTFFKDYTQKVWGTSCKKIPTEWGAQRIKDMSIRKAIKHAIKNIISNNNYLEQKNTEISLIKKFIYPKLGPGQLWEELARIIKSKGGEIYLNKKVMGMSRCNDHISKVFVANKQDHGVDSYRADYVFSTMSVKDLVNGLNPNVPRDIKKVANGLVYRDFITVGLLVEEMKIKNETKARTINNIVPDNWIYIQERDVKIGRLQIFNNWSPYMVSDINKVWLGMEYFCTEGDDLWKMPDKELREFAIDELVKIDIINKNQVLDSVVIRMPKAYPAYFGSYDKFHVIRQYLDQIKNLYLIGRNGMHRYNNQDHSMLTAMVAVENIINSIETKSNIWELPELMMD